MPDNYEEFTEGQIKILEKFVTNTKGSIFVLRNLPEVIKGALFSRYSRSSLGLRSLLLKEFILNTEETAFDSIALSQSQTGPEESMHQLMAIKKAQNFYDRILDGYGDDSIGELGGAHLAIENLSMIAAKAIEDSRIGGSPLEKSTRYIYFDQKVNGEYLFYKEPILMTSAYRDLYVKTCTMLFETYSKMIQQLTPFMERKFPKEAEISKAAYAAAIRAKVLDCLRGLLPASTLTNMGMYGNGRFYEYLIHKMHCHNLVELQEIGKRSFDELNKVIPSFVRRSDLAHKHHKSYAQFIDAMQSEISILAAHHKNRVAQYREPGVRLVSFDPDCICKVAAAILYSHTDRGLYELQLHCKRLPEEELHRILDTAANARENRRQKSPRALEHAQFTFEILADFGSYRDLHRHRIATQEREQLSCHYGYYLPPELEECGLAQEYKEALEQAKEAYDVIAAELPEEAQYIVPMAYNVRWYFSINLRSLQWMCELRSAPAGHPSYRFIAQELAKAVIIVFPQFERFFKFVDFEGYDLGRLGQEQRKAEKLGLD